MSSPEETRAIKLIRDAGLGPKTPIAQTLKPLIMEALREKDQGWLPIETAPKDGKRILLGWFPLYGGDQIEAAWWHSEGRWCGSYNFFSDSPENQPTHWRPLPTPPK